jgi:hypothetical protein
VICGILIHKAKDRGVREKRSAPFSRFAFNGENHGDIIDLSRVQWHGDCAGRRRSEGRARRPKACRSSGSAIAAEVFMNNAG